MRISPSFWHFIARGRDPVNEKRISSACVFAAYISLAAAVILVSCGPAVETSSPTERVLPPAASNYNYVYGTIVKCGAHGNSGGYRGAGWSGIEKDFTWTDSRSAQLNLTVLPPAKPLRLRMRVAGVTKPPDLPFQPVAVYANGRKVADWEVADLADYTADIPTAVIEKGGDLTLGLKMPKAASPKSLGISDDARVLGLCCWEYEISER